MQHQGYTIISQFRRPDQPKLGVALGYSQEQPQPWATWDTVERPSEAVDYFGGKFYFDAGAAKADYLSRLDKAWRV